MKILQVISSIVLVTVVISLLWRLLSKLISLPCPFWLSGMVEMDNPFTKMNQASVIISLMNLKPGMRVLDAGCGPGRLSVPAAQAVGLQGEVTALDSQPGMLARVEEKAKAAGLINIRIINASLGEGKLDNEFYDRAMLVTVLGEIPDKESAMQEIYQSLKPGGVLSVTEVIFDPHFQSQASVKQMACRVGFNEVGFFGKRLAYTIHFQK